MTAVLPTLPNPAACGLAAKALDQALDRLEEAVAKDAYPDHLIPLAEALAWLYSLHNYYRRLRGNDFFSSCEAEESGRVLLALIYARGGIAHDLTDMTVRWQSTRGRGVEWIARDQWRVPGRNDRYGRDAWYDQLVQHQPLLDPLRIAQRFVAGLQ